MPRTHQRRSAEERVAEIERKIEELRAREAARTRKDDPILREIRRLQKSLTRFVQIAHDHQRPDIANSAMGFRAMLERILADEQGERVQPASPDDGA